MEPDPIDVLDPVEDEYPEREVLGEDGMDRMHRWLTQVDSDREWSRQRRLLDDEREWYEP
jgi:hypothetical protein